MWIKPKTKFQRFMETAGDVIAFLMIIGFVYILILLAGAEYASLNQ